MDKGARPTSLNDGRQTAIDLVDSMSGIDKAARKTLRTALLESRNPTAPDGYTKWEAGHGTPWGLEILQSGFLKGGVHDAKGGAESLEGKVFFSDRTPEHDGDFATRSNLRSKPRIYAEGKGTKPSSPVNRGQQYRMIQALQLHVKNGKSLDMSAKGVRVHIASTSDVEEELKGVLQQVLTDKGFLLQRLMAGPSDALASKIKLPGEIVMTSAAGEPDRTYTGQSLHNLYEKVFKALKSDLENGKAPFLNLINNGKTVPVVFGFDRIEGLKTHTISGSQNGEPKKYSYKDENHPLAGSADGGKLKEIEVRDLQDLATLSIAALAKGVSIPEDVVVRISPPSRQKLATGARAQYLTAEQFKGFRARLAREIANQSGTDDMNVPTLLSRQSIESLQNLNSGIRQSTLERMVPDRSAKQPT